MDKKNKPVLAVEIMKLRHIERCIDYTFGIINGDVPYLAPVVLDTMDGLLRIRREQMDFIRDLVDSELIERAGKKYSQKVLLGEMNCVISDDEIPF